MVLVMVLQTILLSIIINHNIMAKTQEIQTLSVEKRAEAKSIFLTLLNLIKNA
jgi:hypothetical protein